MDKYYWLVRQVNKNMRALDSGRILLWSHLGLGDQISASPIIEALLARNVEVVWPVKTRNFDFLNVAFTGWEGLSIVKIHENLREDLQIAKLALDTKSRVVSLGHRGLPAMRLLFPEYTLNSLFNLFIGVDPLNLVSRGLRESLLKLDQEHPPHEPYVFLDHHPGSAREIPNQVLNGIQERGLRVIENPRELPLYSMVRLLDSAQELHMVNSAPLCLALTIDATAPERIHYDTLGDSLARSYGRWKTVALGSSSEEVMTAPRTRTRETEDARIKILSIIKSGLS
jgi:hypothetical protein